MTREKDREEKEERTDGERKVEKKEEIENIYGQVRIASLSK